MIVTIIKPLEMDEIASLKVEIDAVIECGDVSFNSAHVLSFDGLIRTPRDDTFFAPLDEYAERIIADNFGDYVDEFIAEAESDREAYYADLD